MTHNLHELKWQQWKTEDRQKQERDEKKEKLLGKNPKVKPAESMKVTDNPQGEKRHCVVMIITQSVSEMEKKSEKKNPYNSNA